MERCCAFIDCLMDFKKVRAFQEACGLSVRRSCDVNCQENKNQLELSSKHYNSKCAEFSDELSNMKKTGNNRENTKAECCKDENQIIQSPVPTYRINNYFLYYLFLFGSLVGTEVFYISALPVLFWDIDIYIGRMVITVWVVTMYLGQAAKDILRWPRPTWPPVFKLETRVEAEYGLPSTHAIAGTVFPFTILIAAVGRYEFNIWIGITFACLWCGLVSLSRLYVGMHSILDVLAGISLASAYLYFGWPFMEMVSDYTLYSKYAPYIIIVSHFLLAIVYPNSDRWSTSRGDTVIILGVGAGVHCASWFASYHGFDWDAAAQVPQELLLPTLHQVGIGICRYAFGIAFILSVRSLAKYVSLLIICHAVSVSKDDELSRRRTEIEVPYKFITYTCVGFCTNFTVPALLEYLGVVF